MTRLYGGWTRSDPGVLHIGVDYYRVIGVVILAPMTFGGTAVALQGLRSVGLVMTGVWMKPFAVELRPAWLRPSDPDLVVAAIAAIAAAWVEVTQGQPPHS